MAATEGTRKLAAILAADAVGYSRLMAADETATVAALNESRTIFRERIQAHDGRLIDTAGDSVLAEFPSVVEAVQCAMDVQVALVARNAPLDEDRRMPFRIGVNLGDVIEQADGTIYGDGVNIAARLESLAEPCGINVSGAVYDSVHGKIGSGFAYLGEHAVKNIEQPVRVYRVAADETGRHIGVVGRLVRRPFVIAAALAVIVIGGIGAWQFSWIPSGGGISFVPADEVHPPLPTGPSIAVLPFTNLSGDPEQDYLSDAITEDIIAVLGRFSKFSVLARNATVRFKGQDSTPRQIGDALGVRYLLDGSVRRAADRIRVSAQLTDAKTGQHLWSNRYDNEFDDLFSVQDDITEEVAGALAVKLARVEYARAAKKTTDNLEAYDFVVRGWNLVRRQNRAPVLEARRLFERAIELDPAYATAYVGRGETYRLAAGEGYTEFYAKALEQAEALALRALELDPDSVEGRGLLALIKVHIGHYDQAAELLDQALKINPSDAQSYKIYGDVMLFSGHEQAAIEWHEAALRLDPNMEARRRNNLALAYYLDRRYDDAITTVQAALRQEPDLYLGYLVLAAAHAQTGDDEKAAQMAAEVRRLRPFFSIEWFTTWVAASPENVAHLAQGLEKAGFPIGFSGDKQ